MPKNDAFTSRLSSHKIFTALVMSFLLHNVEESYAICKYPINNPFSFFQPLSCREFLFTVSILSIIGIVFYLLAEATKSPSLFLFISTALSAVLLFNVLVPHLVIAVYTLKYTPGLITALTLNLPLCIILLIKNKPFYKSRKKMLIQISIGLGAGYAIFLITMFLTRFLI
jgi:hypothetical protein